MDQLDSGTKTAEKAMAIRSPNRSTRRPRASTSSSSLKCTVSALVRRGDVLSLARRCRRQSRTIRQLRRNRPRRMNQPLQLSTFRRALKRNRFEPLHWRHRRLLLAAVTAVEQALQQERDRGDNNENDEAQQLQQKRLHQRVMDVATDQLYNLTHSTHHHRYSAATIRVCRLRGLQRKRSSEPEDGLLVPWRSTLSAYHFFHGKLKDVVRQTTTQLTGCMLEDLRQQNIGATDLTFNVVADEVSCRKQFAVEPSGRVSGFVHAATRETGSLRRTGDDAADLRAAMATHVLQVLLLDRSSSYRFVHLGIPTNGISGVDLAFVLLEVMDSVGRAGSAIGKVTVDGAAANRKCLAVLADRTEAGAAQFHLPGLQQQPVLVSADASHNSTKAIAQLARGTMRFAGVRVDFGLLWEVAQSDVHGLKDTPLTTADLDTSTRNKMSTSRANRLLASSTRRYAERHLQEGAAEQQRHYEERKAEEQFLSLPYRQQQPDKQQQEMTVVEVDDEVAQAAAAFSDIPAPLKEEEAGALAELQSILCAGDDEGSHSSNSWEHMQQSLAAVGRIDFTLGKHRAADVTIELIQQLLQGGVFAWKLAPLVQLAVLHHLHNIAAVHSWGARCSNEEVERALPAAKQSLHWLWRWRKMEEDEIQHLREQGEVGVRRGTQWVALTHQTLEDMTSAVYAAAAQMEVLRRGFWWRGLSPTD